MTEPNKTDNVVEGLRWLFGLLDLSNFRFNRSIMSNAIEEIERLRKERDEARVLACLAESKLRDYACPPKDYAKRNGWDCYKKDETK